MCYSVGFTGADLQNLMNEAAILAARRNLQEISKEEISDALEKIIAGPEKKGAVVSDAKKKLVAYHEVSSSTKFYLQLMQLPDYMREIATRVFRGKLCYFLSGNTQILPLVLHSKVVALIACPTLIF